MVVLLLLFIGVLLFLLFVVVCLLVCWCLLMFGGVFSRGVAWFCVCVHCVSVLRCLLVLVCVCFCMCVGCVVGC